MGVGSIHGQETNIQQAGQHRQKKIAEGLTLYWETESQASKRKGMGNEAGKGVQMLRKMAWPHLLADTFVKVACP